MAFTDFYQAYGFLDMHPRFHGQFSSDALDIHVLKVNPLNGTQEDDESLNTQTQFWLECGEYNVDESDFIHDYRLDTAGETFEVAIINLANLVLEHYGTYPEEE